jgi:hypothetical protein
MIERAYVADALRRATLAAVDYARPMVVNPLPPSLLYISSKWDSPIDPEGAVSFLWGEAGEVPIWVDIAVEAVDAGHTYLRLGIPSKRT